MKTINVELKTPIKYAPGSGDEIECNFIEINPPTGKIAHLIGILKCEIGTSTKNSIKGIDFSEIDDSNVKDDEDTAESIGDAAFQMLTMGNADMSKVITAFKEILKQSAKAGGEKSFTSPMFDRMDYNDVEHCLKTYIGNFMRAS